jgi:hypothetical protein
MKRENKNTSESLVTTIKKNINSQDLNASQRAFCSNKNSLIEKYFNAKIIDSTHNHSPSK